MPESVASTMGIPEFPAETRQIALSVSSFAASGSADIPLFLQNLSEDVLHIRLSVSATYLSLFPVEVALGVGERQMTLVRIDLDGARNAVKSGASPSEPVRLAYQSLRPGESAAPSLAASGEVYITLPYAVCPSCGRTLEMPDGATSVPETCPFCYERLRACPICSAPNSWLARRCIRDTNHVIRSSPDWESLGGGPLHSGYLSERAPASLARRWSFPSVASSRRENALSWSAPVAAYGMVAASAATNEGEAHIYAFDARTGAPLWDPFPLSEPTYPDRGGIGVANGRLFAATVEGNCVSVDALRGTRLWERRLPGKIYGAVVPTPSGAVPGVSDIVLIPLAQTGTTGSVIALNADNGEILYSVALSGSPDTALAANDGRGYCHNDSGEVTCFSLRNGDILWRSHAGGGFNAAPLLTLNSVISATEIGEVIRWDAESGKEVWRLAVTGAPFSGTPASDGVLIYLPAEDGLHLVSAEAGRAVRRYPVRLPVRSAPIVAGGTLLFGSMDGVIYGAAAGRNLERLYETAAAGSQIIAAPALADDAFFVAATNGILYALSFPVEKESRVGF